MATYAVSNSVQYDFSGTTFTLPGGAVVDSGDAVYDDETGTADDDQFTPGEAPEQTPFFGISEYLGYIIHDGKTFLVTRYGTQRWLESSEDPIDISAFPASFETTDIITTPLPFCFAAGTRIATPSGEVAVESLSIGDPVITADGHRVPVRWIGVQTVSTRFGPAERLMPVRVRAGALGDGVPGRDLVLTADHALLIDGLLINAGALVNGGSIDFVPLAELGDSYTVYHIETEAHDVILAEGTPAETYIDYVARRSFDNYAEYVALFGEDRVIPEMAYPRVSSARQLPRDLTDRLGARLAS